MTHHREPLFRRQSSGSGRLAGVSKRSRVAALPFLLVALAGVGLAGCGGDSDEAKVDGDGAELVVYSGRSEDLVEPLIDRFEEEQDVDVSVRYGDSSELAALIREEGDKSPADLFWAQDAGSLDALNSAKLLKPMSAAVSEPVPAAFKAPDGTWTGTSARARVFAYDTRVLKEADLPQSVDELTDPKWKGKVGWAPSNASFQAFVTAMRATEGEEKARAWVDAMVQNDAQRLENNVAIRDAINSGELQLGLINHYYVAEAKADDPKYPVGVFSPPGDVGAMVNVAGVAALASSDQLPAAEQFAKFLLSEPSQQYFVDELMEYSVLPGFETPSGVTPLDEIKQPTGVDLTELDDHQGTVDLLQDAGVL